MGKRIPVRQCAGCRQMKERTELFRIVYSKADGGASFVLDESGKAQGRGAYLCRSEACLQLARKRNSLERSFKRNIPQARLDALFEEMRQELAGSEDAGEHA